MTKQRQSPTPPRSKVRACETEANCKMVQCAECLRQVPEERAVKSETQDYVRHYCGLDCLHEWEQQRHAVGP